MEVGQKDLLQVDQAEIGAQQLSLRPLAAVDQQPLPTSTNERGRGTAARGYDDPRQGVWEIKERNGLRGATIVPGQMLVLP